MSSIVPPEPDNNPEHPPQVAEVLRFLNWLADEYAANKIQAIAVFAASEDGYSSFITPIRTNIFGFGGYVDTIMRDYINRSTLQSLRDRDPNDPTLEDLDEEFPA